MLSRDTLLTMCASLRAQVGSIQAQIVALEAAIGIGDDDAQEPRQDARCRHEGERTQVGTFGSPEWRCEACGAVVDAP